MDTRFYVRREECWGGTFVYAAWDSRERKRIGTWVYNRRTAERRADKLNADHERFNRRILSPTVTP